ncbi:MAG: hypothetical protein ACK4RK_13710 [Gemmataceae bacterium]
MSSDSMPLVFRISYLLVAKLCLWLMLSSPLLAQPPADLEAQIAAWEKEMGERPAAALAIARAAAAQLREQPTLARRLFSRAVQVQEQHLTLLREEQVRLVVEACQNELNDAKLAARVQGRWLREQEEILDATDAAGRLHLARLTWEWQRDAEQARRLMHDAWHANGEQTASQLRYDDLELLGPPRRVARQLLYRRYLEQRFHDEPVPFVIELEHVKGQAPLIRKVQPLPAGLP